MILSLNERTVRPNIFYTRQSDLAPPKTAYAVDTQLQKKKA